MTENEAKNLLIHIYNTNSRKISENFNGIEAIDVFDMAIKALEEIQKYRAIGTVEECLRNKDFLDFLSDMMNPNDFEVYLRIYNSQDEKGYDEE